MNRDYLLTYNRPTMRFQIDKISDRKTYSNRVDEGLFLVLGGLTTLAGILFQTFVIVFGSPFALLSWIADKK